MTCRLTTRCLVYAVCEASFAPRAARRELVDVTLAIVAEGRRRDPLIGDGVTIRSRCVPQIAERNSHDVQSVAILEFGRIDEGLVGRFP